MSGLKKKICAYHRYLLKGKTKYHIHSPFQFDFACNILEDKSIYPEWREIESYRKHLLAQKEYINRLDAGAGGESGCSVRKMVLQHGIRPRYGRLLFRIVRKYQCGRMLELGTSLGMGTSYMITGNPDAILYSIEACPNTLALARKNPVIQKHTGVKLVEGKFCDRLDEVLKELGSVDLAFIDGDHRKSAVKDNFHRILPFLHNESILIFDDIHWSSDMENAWEEIRKHSAVRLSMDLFQFGILFFKKELNREHVILRF